MPKGSMTASALMPVFDGHNDVLLRLVRRSGKAPERAFLDGESAGHLDWPRMRAGGFAGGFFAIFVPSPEEPSHDVPLPPPVDLSEAQSITLNMAALLLRIERESKGQVEICRSAAQIRRCVERGALAAVLHVEGAEAIDPDLHMLHVLHAAGLRSLGPVWSRPNIFGHGVPFRFPSG